MADKKLSMEERRALVRKAQLLMEKVAGEDMDDVSDPRKDMIEVLSLLKQANAPLSALQLSKPRGNADELAESLELKKIRNQEQIDSMLEKAENMLPANVLAKSD